jgi:hypothetical protein
VKVSEGMSKEEEYCKLNTSYCGQFTIIAP